MAKKEGILLSDRPFSGLARKISHLLGIKFLPAGIEFGRFGDCEMRVMVKADVRGKDVFLLKSFVVRDCYNPNEAYLELFLANDALKRAGARRVIDVLPHMPYLRQDRVKFPGEPVSSKVFADMTYLSGADMVVTVDVHSERNLSFYSAIQAPSTESLFAEHLKKGLDGGHIIIAPDTGAIPRAWALAKLLSSEVVVCRKERDIRSSIVSMRCGSVQRGKTHAIIFDDIIDSGSTLFKVVDHLKRRGVERFTACCTHAILSRGAESGLKRRGIDLITTDSIPLKRKGMEVLSLAETLASAMREARG